MIKINIFWFRRDLRLFDNHALFKALKTGNVLPVFIFDPAILNQLEEVNDKRISFIYSELSSINIELKKYGSSVYTFFDTPVNVFTKIMKDYNVNALYFNHDYEPYAINRDQEIIELFNKHNIEVFTEKDQVIYEKDEILKTDGKPYTIFTPYSRKWKEKFSELKIPEFNSQDLKHNFLKLPYKELFAIEKLGFNKTIFDFPDRRIDKNIILLYHENRDYPFLNGTSKLSIHLRFGTISIRQLVKLASEINQVYLNELIWREFYMMILWHFPHVVNHSFKKEYDLIEWRNDEIEFEAWKTGNTGYPIVDAGMRELNATGFMHNRLRMITASFLTKHLLIDWRWGETYFAQKLIDYELSSNNGGWQWAASSGCDAVPYFRIFNPTLQAKKFDPDSKYTKKWIPELNSKTYAKPIVDHEFARNRALKTFKKIYK